MNIDEMTNEQIFEALKANGVNCGPVSASTRSLYAKKLSKIFADQDSSNISQDTNNEITNISQNNESPVIRQNSPPAPVFQDSDSNGKEINGGDGSDIEDYEGEESMRYLTEEEMAEERRAASYNKNSGKKSSLSQFMIISIAFAAIGVFVYFLLENAEMLLSNTSMQNDETI